MFAGVIDAIGGQLKNRCRRLVLTRKSEVRNAEDFIKATANMNIHTFIYTQEEVEQQSVRYRNEWRLSCPPIKYDIKLHYFCALCMKFNDVCTCISRQLQKQHFYSTRPNLQFKLYATDNTKTTCDVVNQELPFPPPTTFTPSLILSLGSFVAVEYSGSWSLGEIEKIDDEDATVNYMTTVGPNRFSWPAKPDKDVIKVHSVLYIVHGVVNPCSSSGHIYQLDTAEYYNIEDAFNKIFN